MSFKLMLASIDKFLIQMVSSNNHVMVKRSMSFEMMNTYISLIDINYTAIR